MNVWRFVLISLCLVACGDDSNDSSGGSFNGLLGGSTTNERACPMSVAGSQWTTGPIDFDGFIMEAVFEFSDTEIVFSNICEGSTTVSVRSPLKYTYSLDVLEGVIVRPWMETPPAMLTLTRSLSPSSKTDPTSF